MSLVVDNLRISAGPLRIVKGSYCSVSRGERVALVGESGSGKSLTALSVLKLLPDNLTAEGKVEVDGVEVLSLRGERLRQFRWEKVSMVFQDPSSSLNPLMTVGKQVEEALKYHGFEGNLRERVVELFEMAEIPEPEKRVDAYPHQLSGGLKQRVAIAMALACNPGYVVADEPTTALDVTVQKKILELMVKLSVEKDVGILLITHDIGVVAEFSEKLFVMYAGYTVEAGRTEEVLRNPVHPYTKGLIECFPKLDGGVKRKLKSIPGRVPEPGEIETGCPFYPRCPFAKPVCREEMPPIVEEGGRWFRCFNPL